MNIELRDGTTTSDRRLDRLVEFDERSRSYPIRQLIDATQPRSYTWSLTQRLDQGQEGACVGFSWSHELAARPSPVSGISDATALNLYYNAQQLDEWPGGEYTDASPRYSGTSVLAGAKAVQSRGLIKEYRWAFSLQDALLAISRKGPGVFGTNWYSGMFDTDSKGFIRPVGYIAGGHAIVVRGVNVKDKTVRLTNSWGTNWGVGGDCFMTWDDFGRLLSEQGEFCIPIGRSA